ncbi:MAG: GAF domain-containing protein [Anaerolineales bacterium]|nr:GAF domain-containing protein [Anaerolineales bacterium]
MSNSAKKPPEPGRPKKRSSERIQGLFEGLDRLPSAPPGDGQSERVKPLSATPTITTPKIAARPPSAPSTALPPAPPTFPPPAPSKEAAPIETPPIPPSTGKELVILPLAQQGVASQEGDLTQPAGQPLTPLPYESLKQGRPIAQPASPDQPAVLAYGKLLSGATAESQTDVQALLLEVLDEDAQRRWSDDELLLVEQVTDQLTLALENARLFEEARLRNEELTTINQITSVASQTLEFHQLLEEILQRVMQAVDYEGGLISLTESSTAEASANRLYLAVQRNLPATMLQGLTANGLDGTVCDLVYRQGRTLYLPDLSAPSPELHQQKFEPGVLEAALQRPLSVGYRSYLGVPLISKGERLGTVCVFNSAVKPIPEARIKLIEAIGQQVGVMIENTRLFEQTQKARDALQISERYQKNVAQAVAVLTERGVAALSEVLELLGQAAQCSRVHYLETQADLGGAYWRLIAEWRAPQVPSQLSNPLMRRFPIRAHSPWMMQLRSQGYATSLTKDAPAEEIETFQALGARSTLHFAIAGRHEIPGCLAFEQIDFDRQWSSDEIAALQTAASALANTLARDDLFAQVQANLAETEAQYQASARLNSASTYEDILTVLRQHTILGHVNAANIALNLFDRPWVRGERPSRMTPITQWASKNASLPQMPEFPMSEAKTVSLLLDAERTTTVMDASSDPRLDDNARRIFVEQMGGRSLLFAPLNVSGRWIGHLVAVYGQTTGFPEHEVRRLSSLAGQAAVAVESLRLLDETRQRNEELNTLNQVISAVSRTLDLDSVLGEILERVLEAIEFSSGLISIADPDTQELVLAVHRDLPPEMVEALTQRGLGGTVCDLVYRRGETIYAPDVFDPPQELKQRFADETVLEAALRGPQGMGFRSYLGAPLVSKGVRLGTVCAFNVEERLVSPSRLALVEAIGQQVGVAIENARAYKLTQKAMEEIREADRLKTQFLANMSHELRTPLNSIIGFSKVILKGIDGPITEQQTQDLTAIYNSGQHLLGLINDVLDLSRIEAGKMDLTFEENVNLGEIIRSVMSTTIGLVKDKPIQLHTRIAPDLPPVRIDSMKIRQVLINLLSNAAKFTEEGSITVEAETSPQGDEVIVRVIDTGPGIAAEDQTKLFQPFSQVDGSLTRKTGGSGLGLSICHHLIRMHGGRIDLHSELGKGSTFFFTLPVKQQETSQAGAQKNQSEAAPQPTPNETQSAAPKSTSGATPSPPINTPTESSNNTMLILAVDSEPQVAELYRRYLTKHHYAVISMAELDQVAAAARRMQPFAITLDVASTKRPGKRPEKENGNDQLVEINGWQVLEALKADPDTRHIPVIVCSLAAEQERAFQLGAADYLLKPILEDDLVQALERLRSQA